MDFLQNKNSVRRLAVLIGLVLLTAAYYKLSSDSRFIQDDAFTSLRYVENFVNGKGLVFNDGERVEGYTNFLWVILLSIIRYLDLALNLNLDLPTVAQVLSTLFGVPVLITVYFLSKKIIAGKLKEGIASLLSLSASAMTLFTSPFIYWSVSGMETSLFVFLTLLSIYFFLDFGDKKRRVWFASVSVLNSFLRPEGLFFFLLLVSFRFINNILEADDFKLSKKIKSSFGKPLIGVLIIYFIPVASYMVFRLAYYGYPFPNTFYAKTEFTIGFIERGWDYYIEFLKAYLVYGLLYIPTLVQLIRLKTNDKENVLVGFCLVYTLMIIVIGGDVLPIYRFFFTIMPLLFILFINSSAGLIEEFFADKSALPAKYLLAALLIVYSVFNYYRNEPLMMEKRSYEKGLVAKMRIYAEVLKSVNKEEKIKSKIKIESKINGMSEGRNFSVAMSTIGAFSYYSGFRVIDMVGLTDEYIAHHPEEVEGIDEELPVLWKERHYNAGYVLSEKPDYIIFPAGAKPSAFAECAVFVQEEFRRNYYMQLFYSKELNQLLPLFTRLENVRSDSAGCGSGFVKHYINANNLFLVMNKIGGRKFIPQINKELDAMFQKCVVRLPEVNTLKGMAFYHAKNYAIAESYLTKAADADSTNAVARIYLKNIYFSQRKLEEASRMIREIVKFSPYAIPGLKENSHSYLN